MDPKLVCASFRPNPPLTLAAHFDAVTRGQAKSVGMLSIYHLDDVLRAIDSRPDPVEQAALLSELEDRFVAYAAPHGWLLPQALPSEAASADALTTFVVKDILGIAGASAHDAARVAACYVLTIAARYRHDAGDDPTPAMRRRMTWLAATADIAAARVEVATS